MPEISNFLTSPSRVIIEVTQEDLLAFAKYILEEAQAEAKAQFEEEMNARTHKTLTREEAMAKFNIKSATTLWNWERKGLLTPIKVGNKKYYATSEIDKLLKGK